MNTMRVPQTIKTKSSLLKSRYSLFLLLLVTSLFFIQCKKNLTTTSSSAKLTFSTNVLFFDTVFSTIGSTVRVFVVHNYNSEAVVVSSIKLAGYYTSPFKINVDGVPGVSFTNVKIPANDSIYVFATVTVNPTDQNSPLEINDSLVFTTNGNQQSVKLMAFGQDAYIYLPNIFPQSGPAYSVLPCGTTWTNDKPHVIFGYLIVAPGCTLNITRGAGVYLHDSAVLLIDSAATLNVTGTATQPVNFQGDRLEPDYKYLPGQWNQIDLYKSLNCNISWAVIQNGSTGIQVDTVANGTPNPALKMDHTIIKSMSSYGLFCADATVTANDCLIADCQNNCLFLWIGGSYTFNQCTFADYWGVDNTYGQRTTSLLYMNDYYETATNSYLRPINKAFFGNCIIYGALDEEVTIDTANYAGANCKFYFQNCLIKTKQPTANSHYNNVYINQDPGFSNPSLDQYLVANPGSATGRADMNIAQLYPYDLQGSARTPPYTIGAYQQ
jgi:hypothetical protein